MSYRGCRFCQGRGCLACPAENGRDREAAFNNPIITAKLNEDGTFANAKDAEDIRQIVGTSPDSVKTGDPRMDLALNSFLVQMRRARGE